jgi:hypothetical protein
MFVPMLMRDRVRNVQIPDERGALVPLVASERMVFEPQRAPEATAPPNRRPLFLTLGTTLGGLLLWSGLRHDTTVGRRLPRVALAIWTLVVGLIGVLLAFLQLGTDHVYAHGNMNLLPYNPLWLLFGVMLIGASSGSRAARFVAWCGAIGAGLTILAMLIASIPALRQDSLDVLLLAMPANLAAGFVGWRLFGGTSER